MKVRLKPISHPDLEDVQIENSLFAIGRREEPFAQMADGAGKLSRRHARMFIEDGSVYLADLGSLNGTRVNGDTLGTDARALTNGDVIEFGGIVRFSVEIDATDIPQEQALRLVLTPMIDAQLDTIVISRFPFLVNRDDQLFAQFKADTPDEVKRLSRRHALFTIQHGAVHVEDLDSSNGTYLNDKRLDEIATPLNEGDVLRFGGQHFVYRVSVQRAADATQDNDATVLLDHQSPSDGDATEFPSAPASDSDGAIDAHAAASVNATDGLNPDRTRFVESPTSFLEVFCAPEPDDDEPATAQTSQAPKRGQATQFINAMGLTRFGRVGLYIVGAVAVVAGVAGVTYWLDSDQRALRELSKQGRYNEAVAAAGRYLTTNDNDFDVTRLGERALLRSVMPTWAELIDQGKYHEAELYIADAYDAARPVGRGTQMLDLLTWVGRVQQQLSNTSGGIDLSTDHLPVQALVSEWDADQYKHRQLITQMTGYDPSFEPYAATAMSHLVKLRNDDATYGQAIAQFKLQISNALQVGNLQQVADTLQQFTSKYPNVLRASSFQSDLDRLQALRKEFDNNDLFALAQVAEASNFQTAVFASYVNDWLRDVLPPADQVETYERAADMWRAGKSDAAMEILRTLNERVQTPQLARKIERFAQVAGLFTQWQAEPSRAKLMAVRAVLQPVEDAFFVNATEEAFAEHRDKMEQELQEAFVDISRIWETYRTAGGISSLMRLETSVSNQFREQSERLQILYTDLQEMTARVALGVERPSESLALEVEVINEIRRQRMWLEEVRRVSDANVVNAKLALLPTPTGEQN